MASQTQVYQNMEEINNLIRKILEEGNIASTDTSLSFLCPKIQEGMYFLKSMDHLEPKDDIFIFLDNLNNIYEFLNQDYMPMQKIIDFFDTSKPSYSFMNYNEKNGKKMIPFSKIVQDKIGQCLEMALMSQLFFQRTNQESLLCGGNSNQDLFGTHAWNLRKKDNQYFLWDCALKFYAPLKIAEIKNGGLYLHPDFEKSLGNKNKIIYQIGGN